MFLWNGLPSLLPSTPLELRLLFLLQGRHGGLLPRLQRIAGTCQRALPKVLCSRTSKGSPQPSRESNCRGSVNWPFCSSPNSIPRHLFTLLRFHQGQHLFVRVSPKHPTPGPLALVVPSSWGACPHHPSPHLLLKTFSVFKGRLGKGCHLLANFMDPHNRGAFCIL